jgi:hypothetical protein
MPASYEIDTTRRLVISRAWGTLTAQEVREHYREMAAERAFDPSFAQLADLRAVERIAIDPPDLGREALETVFGSHSPRAFVTGTGSQYEVARMYGTYAHFARQNVRVFRSMGDAERWLGLSVTGGDAPRRSAAERELR